MREVKRRGRQGIGGERAEEVGDGGGSGPSDRSVPPAVLFLGVSPRLDFTRRRSFYRQEAGSGECLGKKLALAMEIGRAHV